MEQGISALCIMFSFFGGISLLVWTSTRAKIERIKAERQMGQPVEASPILAELQTLTRQMAEMQSTNHQFNISFDAALDRLENRVGRLETKAAVTVATPDAPPTLRNGIGPGEHPL